MSTLILDILSIVITSVLLTDSPGFTPSAGARMNGSSRVPAPPINSGSDVVFSGSGPTSNIPNTLSLPDSIGMSSNRSRINRHGTHHM